MRFIVRIEEGGVARRAMSMSTRRRAVVLIPHIDIISGTRSCELNIDMRSSRPRVQEVVSLGNSTTPKSVEPVMKVMAAEMAFNVRRKRLRALRFTGVPRKRVWALSSTSNLFQMGPRPVERCVCPSYHARIVTLNNSRWSAFKIIMVLSRKGHTYLFNSV